MTRHLLLTTAAAVLLAASGTTLAAQDTHPETGEPLAETQVFKYRLLDQFPTIDPQLIEETAGGHVARQIFEGLLTQNADGTLRPGVATEWSSEDNQTWTFTLRDNAKWSNGDPVTAHDFVYAWRRAADPATASEYAWYVELTQMQGAKEIIAGEAATDTLGVRAVDDHTLEVTLTQPLPYFPQMAVHYTLMPAHQPTIEAHGADWTDPENIVVNGAYTLAEIRVNEFFRLERNPEYWGAEDVIIDEVYGYVINDANQALSRFQAGEFDMMDDLPRRLLSRSRRGKPRDRPCGAAALFLLLHFQPVRERARGAQGSQGPQGAELCGAPQCDHRPDPTGRSEARLQLYPLGDRRFRTANHRLFADVAGRADGKGHGADAGGGLWPRQPA